MKLNIMQDILASALGVTARAVSTRSTLPVLANVLLTAKGSSLVLAATDLEVGITCQVDAQVEREGQLTVPARTLTDLVATLPKDGMIRLELDADKTALKVRCGASRTEIKGIPASEFPALPTPGDTTGLLLDGGELKEAILQVAPAASEDDARPTLQGVFLYLAEDQAVLYAADGFRLTKRALKLLTAVEKPGGAIIPSAALADLARTLDGSEIQMLLPIGGGRVIFRSQKFEVFA